MVQPKVSIIIPVYNVEKYLSRCLDSLTSQTLKDIEIILVDDSSTDTSPALCDEAASKDERIKVIHKENAGAGMARNSGLEIASGEYIGFVDSDDYVDENMYSFMYGKAKEYDADLVMSSVMFVDGNIFGKEGQISLETYFDSDTLFSTPEKIKELRLGIAGALPCHKDDSRYGMSVWKNLFKRSVIEENNLKFMSEREILSEDALFVMDFAKCAKKAVGIKEAFYYYCRNEFSISKSYKKDRLEKSLIFVNEVEKRLKDDISPDEYGIYLGRFIQAICRVVCSQEIMYANKNKIKYKELRQRLKTICTDKKTSAVLKSYPISKLPLKQAVFAFAMRYRLYLLQKLIVTLRDR